MPIEGFVYFVSHGGEALPSLEMVLQGDGVTVDVVGTTFISGAGITSSTFKEIPDAPFSSQGLALPESPTRPSRPMAGSALRSLRCPTEIMARNGAAIHHSTPIEVEGCPDNLSISSHFIKSRIATLAIYVPATSRVRVAGNGSAHEVDQSQGP